MKNPELARIEREYLQGRLNETQAASQMSEAIGGVSHVKYKAGLAFSIGNSSTIYTLEMSGHGIRKRQIAMLEKLAVTLYEMAKAAGSMMHEGVHIARNCSTKHHLGGIEGMVGGYAPA